jgi:hypothetical protein
MAAHEPGPPGGIARRVIECVARPSSCGGCGAALFPHHFYKFAKHQHALRSWVVHEHLTHRVGFENIRVALDRRPPASAGESSPASPSDPNGKPGTRADPDQAA